MKKAILTATALLSYMTIQAHPGHTHTHMEKDALAIHVVLAIVTITVGIGSYMAIKQRKAADKS